MSEKEVMEIEESLNQEAPEDTSQQVEQPVGAEQDRGGENKPEETAKETSQPAGNPKWWTPDAFKLKYRGQTVSPRDYQHATALMQQGWSYTQAMEQLKRDREAIEAQKGKYAQYENLEKAFQSNPAFAQRIWQMYQEAQQGKQQPAAQQQPMHDPQYQQLFQTVSQMQQRLQSWDAAQADQSVQREIEDLKSSEPDVQWEQVTETGHTLVYDVLNHAYRNKFPNLMAAARDYLWDTKMANARMQGAQQVATAKQRAAKAGVVQTGSNSPVQAGPAKVNIRDVSYDDLAAMALKDLGKS